ncbi:divalent-cation tolerance protein CutA [Blastomonas sp.]|uniref:divalent-cation tolerance protein CutA n=1 Tax=Blastomonas sp. TaxID=1909299 RepID=UPI002620ED75|nr:divalent-cation tolerance protein CutA [Blastomonas sp.]MDM7955870.1 divalent-cation tolerance protein CutA [Blastomonas sp.]
MIGDLASEPSDIRLVYCPFADEEQARTIARTVVREQLAACANILAPVLSVFHWQGELSEQAEVPVLFKTALPQSKALVARIVHLHSYEEPAVLVLPVDYCPPSFRAWVFAQTLAVD